MSRLSVKQIPCGLGVEVSELTIDDLKDQEVLDELKQLFDQHFLIKTRIENFEEEHQYLVGSAIGEITDRSGPGTSSKNPGMQYVSNSRPDGILGKGAIDFHHDHLFYEEPLKAIMLYAIEVPESGSETFFRSAIAFLDALPSELHEKVKGIECKHLYDYTKLANREYRDWDDDPTPGSPSDYKPFIWHDDYTGKEALLLSQSTLDFRGIDRDEGIALYKQLYDFGVDHADEIKTYEHRWKVNDLIIWNNLMVAHARKPFEKDAPRTLRRTPIL